MCFERGRGPVSEADGDLRVPPPGVPVPLLPCQKEQGLPLRPGLRIPDIDSPRDELAFNKSYLQYLK